MTTAAIVQSSYLPWKGYFDLIRDADVFVFYDDAQYTSRDWRNRNRLKGPNGPFWITVPVSVPSHDARVCDVTIADDHWAGEHWHSLVHHYARALANIQVY